MRALVCRHDLVAYDCRLSKCYRLVREEEDSERRGDHREGDRPDQRHAVGQHEARSRGPSAKAQGQGGPRAVVSFSIGGRAHSL